MIFTGRDYAARAVVAAGASVVSLVLALGAAQAQDKTYVMKIALPTLNDPSHQYAKNFAAAIEKNSGGRIKPEIYPASQLGSIPRMIEGTQFGAIQCAIIPPDFFVGIDARFEVMAAPGLVDTMQHAQRLAADPAALKVILGLGADKGLHGVGISRERTVRRDLEIGHPPRRRLQGQENPHLRLGLPVRDATSGWARRQWR